MSADSVQFSKTKQKKLRITTDFHQRNSKVKKGKALLYLFIACVAVSHNGCSSVKRYAQKELSDCYTPSRSAKRSVGLFCHVIIRRGPIFVTLLVRRPILLTHPSTRHRNKSPPIRFPRGKAEKGNDYCTACDTHEVIFSTGCIDVCDTVYFAQSPNVSCNGCACDLPNFSSALSATTPADSYHQVHSYRTVCTHKNHPSLAGISRESSLSGSITGSRTPPSAQFSPTSQNLLYVGDLPTTFTPQHITSRLDFNSTASCSASSSSNHIAADQCTAIKGSQSLRTLVINFQSLRQKKIKLWNLLSFRSRHHHWIRNMAEARHSQRRDIPSTYTSIAGTGQTDMEDFL